MASIDPRNNMPTEPNQQPVRGQKQYISTYRLQSNIPKGGTDATWLYPSPQMFYNGNKSSLVVYMIYTLSTLRLRLTVCFKRTTHV